MSPARKNQTPVSTKLIPAQIALRKHATSENKKINEWFFKTGPGQYGHGDQFIGVKVPKARIVAKEYADLSLADLKILLHSPVHEDRGLAVMILRGQYEKAARQNDAKTSKIIFDFFLRNKKRINNWDLVDGSAPYISGHYIYYHPDARKKIFGLIHSKSMWDRRIAILSTFYFIRQNQFEDTLRLARILLADEEDLMHKASGWMLRELGKKNVKPLLRFLNEHTPRMPRTMLRYAIEKFPEPQRQKYLKTAKIR